LAKSSFSTRPCSPPRRQLPVGMSTTSHVGLPLATCDLTAGHASGMLSWLMVMPSFLAAGSRIATVCAF
jgi:hypothetical protein